ncbi:MAG: phenylalanine--tRNA ligase subunit beta [Ruminococcaceae bacterium]|nr:phenylalanine--tRNA ligase subunit beta [Oscillospiraceae bacterium]
MYLSKRWLADFVAVKDTDKNFAEALTLSGSKVEGYEVEGSEFENIVVGKIDSIEKHPDADNLWVCSVDIGESTPLQIVTGAQNLTVGDIIPVAKDNSVISGGKRIKAGELRGVKSEGMLCSIAELGLTLHDFPYAVEDGIFILGDDCDKTLGLDIRDAIGLNDTIVEFEITSNRPDCLSVVGLAREVAATYDLPFEVETPVVKNGIENVADYLKVDIEVPETCYRYVGGVVKNARIAPSPRWMRERLRASGVRPINNIVDITNYVMLEYGQPMHAFDLRFLEGNHVIVRNAVAGETITTLDGEERELTSDIMVIADAKKPVAVAGVMGGEYSGIMDDTKTIVFESACFNGPSVRRAAKALGMRTESSSRFEKQLNPDDCNRVLTRALELVQLLDAGDVVSGVVDRYVSPVKANTLPFDPEWTNKFIGINISADKQAKILRRIGFSVENGIVTIPTFRNDVTHQADLSEEIARFYGYNNIPSHALSGIANASLTKRQSFNALLEKLAISSGLSEVQSFSFVSPKDYDKICLPSDSTLRDFVVILNPLGEDTSVMRTSSMPSMLSVLARNYNNRNESALLFELATVYKSNGLEELPDENQELVIGMYGKDTDYYVLKGIIEEILYRCGISDYDITAVTKCPVFHPGRCGKILINEKEVAILGEVHPQVLTNYEIETRAYMACIDVEYLFNIANLERVYKALPKFPATTYDLAFVVEKTLPVLTLQKTIVNASGENLESIELFDVYEGTQVGEGKKSVAFNLKFRSAKRTLTDEECNLAINAAIEAAEGIGAVLRS